MKNRQRQLVNFYNKKAWRRVILAGLPQLPSPLQSLTSVFGMGTGVSFVPLSPDI
jgi:hypothetical protein